MMYNKARANHTNPTTKLVLELRPDESITLIVADKNTVFATGRYLFMGSYKGCGVASQAAPTEGWREHSPHDLRYSILHVVRLVLCVHAMHHLSCSVMYTEGCMTACSRAGCGWFYG